MSLLSDRSFQILKGEKTDGILLLSIVDFQMVENEQKTNVQKRATTTRTSTASWEERRVSFFYCSRATLLRAQVSSVAQLQKKKLT